MQLIVELCAQINVSIYLCTNTLLVIMSTAVAMHRGEGMPTEILLILARYSLTPMEKTVETAMALAGKQTRQNTRLATDKISCTSNFRILCYKLAWFVVCMSSEKCSLCWSHVQDPTAPISYCSADSELQLLKIFANFLIDIKNKSVLIISNKKLRFSENMHAPWLCQQSVKFLAKLLLKSEQNAYSSCHTVPDLQCLAKPCFNRSQMWPCTSLWLALSSTY